MKKLISILVTLFFSFSLFAETKVEIKGVLLTNFGTTSLESSTVDGFHSLGLREFNGGIHEILVPATESARFYNRFAGQVVVAELIQEEGVAFPVLNNLAIFINETQVNYWTNATHHYFEFPQVQAKEDLSSQTVAGKLVFDDTKVSKYCSGFVIFGQAKIFEIGKTDRRTMYILRGLVNQVATFILGDAKLIKDPSATEEEEKQRENQKRLEGLIKPTQVGNAEGKTTKTYSNGANIMHVNVGDDLDRVQIYIPKDFDKTFVDEKYAGAILKAFFRKAYNEKGLVQFLESYEVIKENPTKFIKSSAEALGFSPGSP